MDFEYVGIRYAVSGKNATVRSVSGRLFPPYFLNLCFIRNWYDDA